MSCPSPEHRLLLLTAGPEAADQRIVEAVRAGPRWPELLELAERDGVTGVVWRRLQRLGCAPAAGPETLAWQRAAMRADHRALVHGAALDELLEALVGAGVRPVLLKGAALARTVYDRAVDRPMNDADVLLAPPEVAEAERVAAALGWASAFDDSQRPLTEFYEAHHHRPPLVHGRTGARLELHTELFADGHPFGTLTGDLVRARARGGVARLPDGVAMPAGHDLVLHLALHFAWSHALTGGAWRAAADLVALHRHGILRWDEVPAIARTERAELACFWTLALAGELAGLPVPSATLESLRGRLLSPWLSRRLAPHFVRQVLGDRSCPSVTLARLLWRAGLQPRRTGHGGVMPWSRDHLFPGEDAGATRDRWPARLAASFVRLPAIWRYLGALRGREPVS